MASKQKNKKNKNLLTEQQVGTERDLYIQGYIGIGRYIIQGYIKQISN